MPCPNPVPSHTFLLLISALSNHHPRKNRTLPPHPSEVIMSLEATFLLNRPTGSELQARGLLEDAHLAPALQGTARALRQALTKDQLSSELASRPGAHSELQARGLLEDAAHLAPALQGTARTLRQAMTKDCLSSELASRPDAHSLQDKGVHSPSSNLSPALLSAAHTLEHSLKKDAVSKSLRERPTKEELPSSILSPPMA